MIEQIESDRKTGGVGHDSQSVPGEFFAQAHFHLIAEEQTSPRVEGELEIIERLSLTFTANGKRQK